MQHCTRLLDRCFFGLILILLVKNFLTTEKRAEENAIAVFMAVTGICWFLYRLPGLAPLVAVGLMMVFLRKWHAAKTYHLITIPIVVAWLTLFLPRSNYVSDIYSTPQLIERQITLFQTILETVPAFYYHLTPVGLCILILCSICVAWKGSSMQRILLGATWFIAGANIAGHTAIAPDWTGGYGRYNALIMLPLCVSVAVTPQLTIVRKKWSTFLAGALCIALVSVTPWNVVSYANALNIPIYNKHTYTKRMTTLGHHYTQFPRLVEKNLNHIDTMIAVGLSSAFIDLFISEGRITPIERTALLARSNKFQPGDPGSPIIIQDPKDLNYFQLTKDEETKLRALAIWARTQPNVEEHTIGGQTTLFIP